MVSRIDSSTWKATDKASFPVPLENTVPALPISRCNQYSTVKDLLLNDTDGIDALSVVPLNFKAVPCDTSAPFSTACTEKL